MAFARKGTREMLELEQFPNSSNPCACRIEALSLSADQKRDTLTRRPLRDKTPTILRNVLPPAVPGGDKL